MLAPIVIFAYNRPESLRRLLDSLAVSPYYKESEVFIFVDGAHDESEVSKVEKTIDIAKSATINVIISATNKGLGPSIISGVTEVIRKFRKVIVLEDDLRCAPDFLKYMNEGLNALEQDKRICAICGYGLKIKRPSDYKADIYLSNRASSWGWGTWIDRWKEVDWGVTDYAGFIDDRSKQKSFNKGGSDMTSMLRGYMEGKNRSWAIRFCYWQWKNGLYSVHPFKSLIDNEGFGEEATNCRQKYSRFKTEMNLESCTSRCFADARLNPNEKIFKQLRKYHSIGIRIYSKLRKILNM